MGQTREKGPIHHSHRVTPRFPDEGNGGLLSLEVPGPAMVVRLVALLEAIRSEMHIALLRADYLEASVIDASEVVTSAREMARGSRELAKTLNELILLFEIE